jgi:hypothetical protein
MTHLGSGGCIAATEIIPTKLTKSVTWISVFHGARQIPTLSCTGCIELDYCIELIVASVTRPKVANFIATEAL